MDSRVSNRHWCTRPRESALQGARTRQDGVHKVAPRVATEPNQGVAITVVRDLRCKTTAEDAGLAGDADSRADGGTDERQRACEAAPFGRLLRCAPKDRGKVLGVRELDTCPSLRFKVPQKRTLPASSYDFVTFVPDLVCTEIFKLFSFCTRSFTLCTGSFKGAFPLKKAAEFDQWR